MDTRPANETAGPSGLPQADVGESLQSCMAKHLALAADLQNDPELQRALS